MVGLHVLQLPLFLVAIGAWDAAYNLRDGTGQQLNVVVAVRLLLGVNLGCNVSRVFLALRAWGLVRARRPRAAVLAEAHRGLVLAILFALLNFVGDVVLWLIIDSPRWPTWITSFLGLLGYRPGEFAVPWFGAATFGLSLFGTAVLLGVAYWPNITHPLFDAAERNSQAPLTGTARADDSEMVYASPASTEVAQAERSVDAEAAKTKGEDIIICCSGGGIRAAAFSLGGLQALQDEDIYQRASAVVGVSGGGYTAAAHHVVRWNVTRRQRGPSNIPTVGGSEKFRKWPRLRAAARQRYAVVGDWNLQPDSMSAYAADSPELHYLRRNTRYVMDGVGTLIHAVLSLAWGIAVNVVLLLISIGAVGWLLGWLFLTSGRLNPGEGKLKSVAPGVFGGDWGPDWRWVPWLCASLVIAGIAAFAVEKLWDRFARVGIRFRALARPISKYGLIGGGVLAALLLGLPWVVEWINGWVASSASSPARLLHQIGFVPETVCEKLNYRDACGVPRGGLPLSQASADLRANLASIAAVVTSVVAVLASLSSSGSSPKGEQGNLFIRALYKLWAKIKDPVVPYLAVAVIGVVVLSALVRTVSLVVTDGLTIADWSTGLKLTVALIAVRLFIEPNRTSLHHFFRERISNSFFVHRSSETTVASIDYRQPLRFSRASPRKGPRLVSCAVANVSDAETIPSKRGCTPFVFDDAQMGLTDRVLPNATARRSSAMYEFAADYSYRDATIPAAVAMSAAAFSPLAGRENAKIKPYRVVLALGNARLGVWLPNPMWIDEIGLLSRLLALGRYVEAKAIWAEMASADRRYATLTCRDIDMVPEPDWAKAKPSEWNRHLAERLRTTKALHVVGSDRDELVTTHQGPGWSEVRRSWWELGRSLFKKPGIFSLVQEAFGNGSVHDRFLYVTDGGHYDNLGLIEALRRRPDEIYVLDASNDREDAFGAIGQAMATAQMDLGCVITIDPREMAKMQQPRSGAAWCSGTYRYVDGAHGRLHIAKAILTEGNPWDLEAYAAAHPDFPRTSTGRQLYSEFDFEAYRALGNYAVNRLLKTLPRRRPPVR